MRLGQSASEVLKLFPTLKKDRYANLGVTSYAHNTVVGQEALNPPALRGVEMMRLSFLDDRLYYVVITYGEYEPSSVSDFVRQAATTMRLPATGWKQERSSAVLNCEGFSVTVQTGRDGRRVDYPALIISDRRAEAEFARRYKAQQDERQRQETERRRREDQRRRVFKPWAGRGLT